MTIILLEALGALLLFVAAVWWTMFAGRDKGELRRRDEEEDEVEADAPPDATDADTPSADDGTAP